MHWDIGYRASVNTHEILLHSDLRLRICLAEAKLVVNVNAIRVYTALAVCVIVERSS